VIALLGAALGVASAWKASHLLLTMASHSAEVAAMNVSPDLRVLAFSLALTVFTALLFGMTPAIRATRIDLNTSLKQTRTAAAPSSRFFSGQGIDRVADRSLAGVACGGEFCFCAAW